MEEDLAHAPRCSMSKVGQIGVWVVQGFDAACEAHQAVAPDSGERSYALTGLAAACELMNDMKCESTRLARKVLVPSHYLSVSIMPVVFDEVDDQQVVELERADRRALSHVAHITSAGGRLMHQESVVDYEIQVDTDKALVAPRRTHVDKFFWQTSSSGGASFLPLVSTGPYILLTSVLKLRDAAAHRLANPHAAHVHDKVVVAEVLALALLADISKAEPTHAQGVNESSWIAFADAAPGADIVAARAFVEQGALGTDVAREVAQWCKEHARPDDHSGSPVAAKSIKHALDWVKQVLQSAPGIHGQGRSNPPPAVELRSLGEVSRARFVPEARRLASGF
ncbi:hypothetical protein JCM3775_001272 [Rhodotorula graminis]